jgi:type VI secretion system protein ImpG
VFLSLVDGNALPYSSDLRQLAIRTLCTNRDLALQMPVGRGNTDFTMDGSAPVRAFRCVAGPTPPRPAYMEGELAWRAVSHLSLNYLSIADSAGGEGAPALRDLLRLYADVQDPQTRKQLEGLAAVTSRPITRRIVTNGPIAFARGVEVSITFDEKEFEGVGAFLLGAVLERFFARYVSINSFTETVVRSKTRGEIMRWPTRPGIRHVL